jgi:hypothetical protein
VTAVRRGAIAIDGGDPDERRVAHRRERLMVLLRC